MRPHSVATLRVGPNDFSVFLGFPHQGQQRVALVNLDVPRSRASVWKNSESFSSILIANGFNCSNMVSSVSFSVLTRLSPDVSGSVWTRYAPLLTWAPMVPFLPMVSLT